MSDKALTTQDFENAAKDLHVEPAVIMAVSKVESGKSGFLPDGRVKILFEGHVFWRRLVQKGIDPKKHVKGNESVLYQKWTKEHYSTVTGEHDRLNRAAQIHKEAAYESASWGKYQIMGFHAVKLGYASASDMAEKMGESEKNQLDAFVRFIRVAGLADELQKKDWQGFARQYNGKEFGKNKYDVKLEAAYKEFSR